jgi:hypothetical protein
VIAGTLHGPVVVNEPGLKNPVMTWKVVFPDGVHIVVAAPTRLLWAGADGRAYDVARTQAWKIIGVLKEGVIRL